MRVPDTQCRHQVKHASARAGGSASGRTRNKQQSTRTRHVATQTCTGGRSCAYDNMDEPRKCSVYVYGALRLRRCCQNSISTSAEHEYSSRNAWWSLATSDSIISRLAVPCSSALRHINARSRTSARSISPRNDLCIGNVSMETSR